MGNSTSRETQVVVDALASVNALLPAPWALTARTDAETVDQRFDAVVDLTGPVGASARLVVEAKRSASVSSAAIVSTLRDIGRAAALPVLYASPYIGPALRKALAAEGFSYADATGWVRLALDDPPVVVTGQGAAKAPKDRASSAVTRLNGVAASRSIRALASTDAPVGVRELAAAAGVSPGSVSKLLATLVAEGIVERDEAGKITSVRRRDLIRRWTHDYSFSSTNPVVAYFIAPRGLPRAIDRLVDVAPVMLTGSAAARTLLPDGATPVAPMRLLALYATDPRDLARSLGLIDADPTTANVVIAAPADQRILPDDGVAVAPAPLVVADLLTLPGRADAEAEQLMDSLEATDPAWKDDDGSRS